MNSATLSYAGLELPEFMVEEKVQSLSAHLATFEGDIAWEYMIPELGEGGACSLFGHLQEEPFRLRSLLGDPSNETTESLVKLTGIVDFVVQQTGLDWFGIYQTRSTDEGRQLLKLAYHGAPSRPLFPLTEQFAATSNNVQVALSRKARVINDVASYVSAGGEYYTCDPKVQAEACLPLLDSNGNALGIIDGEAFRADFFNSEELAVLVAACLVIPDYLPA